jgi:hypothetical protein
MKKIIILITIGIAIVSTGLAQNLRQGDAGTVEAIKIGYFTKQLSLSPDEAQKFWPIYNQYVNEIRQTRQQNRDLDEVSLEEKIVNIRKKYKTEFSKALSPDKVNQFFKVEKDFNNFIRKEMQDRNQLRRNRN